MKTSNQTKQSTEKKRAIDYVRRALSRSSKNHVSDEQIEEAARKAMEAMPSSVNGGANGPAALGA